MLIVAFAIGGNPSGADFGYGALAGLAGAAGVAMLYGGLASGAMSLVAPITGVVAVVVPIAVGVGSGERPAALQYVGILAAVVAVALLSGGGSRGLVSVVERCCSQSARGSVSDCSTSASRKPRWEQTSGRSWLPEARRWRRCSRSRG